MTTRRILLAVGAAAVALLAGVALWPRGGGEETPDGGAAAVTAADVASRTMPSADAKAVPASAAQAGEAEKGEAEATGETSAAEADGDEEAAAAAVDAFDAEVDRWMEPCPGGVSVRDVEAFRTAFGRVPDDARETSLQHALNLIPDENIMLLTGLLLDRTQCRETLETVFGDVLNRDEDVKRPLIESVFKDRKHPCWAEAAWILDVTGWIERKDGD